MEMPSKKRVLLVHNFYQIGGGEHTVFENEKALLQENGHAVFTYTRNNMELKEAKWKMALLPLTTVWSVRTYFQMRRLIRENQIDIVHCHNTFPLISPAAYYAARNRKVPVVQTVHNFRFLCPNGLLFCDGKICEKCLQTNSFLPALKNRCYRDSRIQTAVAVAMLKFHRWIGTYKKINYIFLTEFNKSKFEVLIDINAENVFVKPNFVHKPAVSSVAEPVEKRFVYAGRLDENKGIRFLLDAWTMLPEDYELHIYGDGVYREACEKAARDHKNIHFFGFRPQQEIQQDLAEAAALVFPSVWYETFGMSWAESFAMKKPVLAAAVGNHGSIVGKSWGGLVYAPEDRDAFCAAAKELIENNQFYAENALRYFEDCLCADRNYEMLSEIYEKAKHIR